MAEESFRITGDSSEAVNCLFDLASAWNKVDKSMLTAKGTFLTVEGYLRKQTDMVRNLILAKVKQIEVEKRVQELWAKTPQGKLEALRAEIAMTEKAYRMDAEWEQKRFENWLKNEKLKEAYEANFMNRRVDQQREEARKRQAIVKEISLKMDATKFTDQNFGARGAGASTSEIAATNIAIAQYQKVAVAAGLTHAQQMRLLGDYLGGVRRVYTAAEQMVLPALDRIIKKHNQEGDAAARAAEKAALAQRRAMAGVSTSYESANSAGRQMLLSWGSMVRLVTIQTLHMALGRLTHAAFQAGRQFMELTQQISEIRIISLEAQYSFEQWMTTISSLSSEYGKATKDVAEGFYQLISNQTAKGAQAVSFMADALMFARTAVTSVTTAVELGSTAVNAYGYSASQSQEIFAMFMKTIELGRLRAEDMNATFGRAASQARILGVEMTEFLAIYSVLTKMGVDSPEAMTLFNEIIRNLIKPTKEMKAWFNEKYGTESISAIISMRTFIGLLHDMETAAQASGNKLEWLSDMFSRARGMRGGAGLFTSGTMQRVDKEQTQIIQSPDEYKQKMEEAINPRNYAYKLQQMTETFKNHLMLNVVGPILESVAKLGDKDGLVQVFQSAQAAIAPLVDLIKIASKIVFFFAQNTRQLAMAFVTLRIVWKFFAIAAIYDSETLTRRYQLFGATIKTVENAQRNLAFTTKLYMGIAQAGIALLITSIITMFAEASAKAEQFRMEAEDAIKDLHQIFERRKDAEDVTNKNTVKGFFVTSEEYRRALDERYQVTLNHVSAISKLFNTLAEMQKQIWENIVKNIQTSWDAYIDGLKDQLEDFRSKHREAERGAKESETAAWEGRHKGNTDIFDENLKKTDDDVAASMQTYAQYFKYLDDMRLEYKEKAKSGDPDDIARLRKLYNEEAALAKRYYDYLDKMKDDKLKGSGGRKLHAESENAAVARAAIPAAQQFLTNVRASQQNSFTETQKIQEAKAVEYEAKAKEQKRTIEKLQKDFHEFDKLAKHDPTQMPHFLDDPKASIAEWERKTKNLSAALRSAIENLTNNPELKKSMADALKASEDEVARMKQRLIMEQELKTIREKIQKAKDDSKAVVEEKQKLVAQLEGEQKNAVQDAKDIQARISKIFPEITLFRDTDFKQNSYISAAFKKGVELGFVKPEKASGPKGEYREAYSGEMNRDALKQALGNAAVDLGRAKTPEEIEKATKTFNNILNFIQLVARGIGESRSLAETYRGDRNPNIKPVGPNNFDSEQFDSAGRWMGTKWTGVKDQLTVGELAQRSMNLVGSIKELYDKRAALEAQTIALQEQMIANMPKLTDAQNNLAARLAEMGANAQQQNLLIKGIQELIDEMKKLIDRFPVPKAAGGFLTGGIPGRDSIPIMAMPGEYVVNARATAQFLPALEAINRGHGLQGFASGGYIAPSGNSSVSNTTSVGGIYITVQGGDTSEETVQNIATQLRRELRRGTVSL